MTATALQAWIAGVGALLAGVLGILKYFSYRTRQDRISLVGQAFNSTVEGLSSDAEAKKLCGCRLFIRPGQAACRYSWRTPPRRSCRRISMRVILPGSVIGSGNGRRGAACPRAR